MRTAVQRQNWLIAVPQPLSSLANLVQEVHRWEWVSTNVPELNADKYAREEGSRQKAIARSQLEKHLQSFISWKQLNGPQTWRMRATDRRHASFANYNQNYV